MTYLLARPALRRLFGESQPTKWEESILRKMADDAGKEPPGQLRMVETIFEARFLRDGEARDRALEQMWSLQYGDGNLKRGWAWYNAGLEPWEGPSSFYFGSSMAPLALGHTPADYRAPPEISQLIADVTRSSAYATAFTAYVLLQAGRNPAEGSLKKALDWPRTHQDPKTGAWSAGSMNKKYEAGSMQELFLQDSATGFAATALAGSQL